MEKNWNEEIERINAELAEIKKMIGHHALPAASPALPEGGQAVLSPEGQAHLSDLRDQLAMFAEQAQETGAVAYAGSFEANGQQSIWARSVQTDFLLTLNDQGLAEAVLASIGSSQRLAIVLALLKHPLTVAQLVEYLGARSTGLIYHHLKPLLLADLLYEDHGVYAVKPHRVQGLIMLLAAIWDLTESRYSSGAWEKASADKKKR